MLPKDWLWKQYCYMRQKSKKKFSIVKKIPIAVGFCIFVGLLFLLFKSGILNIKNVEMHSVDLSCASKSQLLNSAQIKGKNFFLVDSQSVSNIITAKFICVKSVALVKTFPDQVKMNVLNRQAKAQLITLKNSESSASSLLENTATPSAHEYQNFYLIDDEGTIFSKSLNSDTISKIYIYDSSQNIGQKLAGSNAKNILAIFDKVKLFGLDTKNSVIVNNYYIIFSLPKVIFRLDSSIDIQLASLQLILEKAKIDLKSMEFIDLRYDKPVVRYTPKKNG